MDSLALLPSLSTLACLFLPLAATYFSAAFVALLWRQRVSPLRHLPGPPNPSFFLGNLAAMHDQENTNLIADWEAQYGPNFVYHGFIGGCRLMTTDPRAIAHILGNAYDYPKPDFVRDSLATMAAGHDGACSLSVCLSSHRARRAARWPARRHHPGDPHHSPRRRRTAHL